jgi:hypothetical protein
MFVTPVVVNFPPHTRGVLLIADKGVFGFSGNGAPGVNGYAVTGTVIGVPGFPGGFAVGKYPADFEFPRSVTREEFLNTLNTVAMLILSKVT